MNKDDIKDALTVCANNSCSGCLYYEFGNCYDKLKLDARDLITVQEKEIERLRTTLGQCNTELNSALESLKSQCREIGELKADYAKLQELFAQYQMASDKEIIAQKKQAKIDVLTELKGRLGQVKIDDTKIKFWKVTDMSGTLEQAPIDYKPVNIIIDELIKEIKE